MPLRLSARTKSLPIRSLLAQIFAIAVPPIAEVTAWEERLEQELPLRPDGSWGLLLKACRGGASIASDGGTFRLSTTLKREEKAN